MIRDYPLDATKFIGYYGRMNSGTPFRSTVSTIRIKLFFQAFSEDDLGSFRIRPGFDVFG